MSKKPSRLDSSQVSEMEETPNSCFKMRTQQSKQHNELHLLFLTQWEILYFCIVYMSEASALCCYPPARAWTVCPMNVNHQRKSPMDAPTISLWVQQKIIVIHCNFFSQQVLYLETAHSKYFFYSQVMNGLIISHNVKDHTNGNAPLRSLPVIIHFFVP